MFSFNISCYFYINSIKFAQAINTLLLNRRELFYIVYHGEILIHNTFSLQQQYKLRSSHSNNCGGKL